MKPKKEKPQLAPKRNDAPNASGVNIAPLLEALKPFADMAQKEDADHPHVILCMRGRNTITCGDLANARDALSKHKK